VKGLSGQKSTVARPFQFAEMPGSTGSIWARNCWARSAGVPEPKLAPTSPPVVDDYARAAALGAADVPGDLVAAVRERFALEPSVTQWRSLNWRWSVANFSDDRRAGGSLVRS
jgi:hypothetical protein